MFENRTEGKPKRKIRLVIELANYDEFRNLNVGELDSADIEVELAGVRLEMDDDSNEYRILTLKVNSLKLTSKTPLRV